MSFTINNDGVQLFDSSYKSLHPIYLVINELDKKNRFKIANVIFAGIWVGSKPNFNDYLDPIILELKSLDQGEIIKINSEEMLINMFTIFGIFDKPARSAILNMMQWNGSYGCLKYYQPGKSLPTNKGGTVRVFPYQQYNPSAPHRFNKSYDFDLKQALNDGKTFRGVKGETKLRSLKYYYPIESTGIDFMHSLCLGVGRQLLNYFFSPKYSKEKFS